MNRKIIIIIALFLIVIVAGFAAYLFLKLKKPEQPVIQTWPEQKFKEEDYSGWETFTHDELGYSIKYPADWIVYDQREYSVAKEVIINPPNAEPFTSYISIGIDDRDMAIIRKTLTDADYEIRSKFPDYKLSTETEIIFADQKAYQFSGRIKDSRRIYISRNNKIYSIGTDKEQNQQVRQVLASFKFVD